jgi:hypothetical protein
VLSAWCGIRPLASDPTQVHLPALTLPVTLLTPLTLFISLLHVSNMSSVYVETIRLVPPAQGEHCPQSKARKYASPALLWAAGLTTLCDGRVVSTHTHWPVSSGARATLRRERWPPVPTWCHLYVISLCPTTSLAGADH